MLSKFKTVSLSFWVAHWHTTQVYWTTQIQNGISFVSGGKLAHDSSEFKILYLSFRLAHWHTTQVYCNAQIQNGISFVSGGTLAHDSSLLY
jgi:hypothetical protein